MVQSPMVRIMTYFFPNINLNALSKFAAETAAIEHPQHDGGSQPLPVTPRVVQMQDIHWAGEKVGGGIPQRIQIDLPHNR